MNRSDSSRAPAPIASIPITAPTPKMMPRAVSRVRVFCAQRFEPASAKSDMYRLTVNWVEFTGKSLGQRLHRAAGFSFLFRRFRRIRQRDELALVDACQNDTHFIPAHQRHVLWGEARGRLHINKS